MEHDEPATPEADETPLLPLQRAPDPVEPVDEWIIKYAGSGGELLLLSQASGVMTARYGLDPSEAVAMLRRLSREQNRPVEEVARELVYSAQSEGLE